MLPLVNVACANMTREQVEVAEASFSTSIIEHVSELGHGLGSEAGNTNRLDGVVDEQGNVTDASILQGLRMVVPVSSENRAVDPLGNLAVNMGELVQLGGVSGEIPLSWLGRMCYLMMGRLAAVQMTQQRSGDLTTLQVDLYWVHRVGSWEGFRGLLTRRAPQLLLLLP